MAEGLHRERDGAVVVARLDRPDSANALDPPLIEALGALVIEAESDPDLRVVVLTGTGERTFCAGLDLKAAPDGGRSQVGDAEWDAFGRLMDGEVDVPLVGAANGTAVGGGLELLLACDVIVAADGARFGLPEVRRGLFPGGNGTAVSRRVPLGVALELTLTGDLIDAARAHEVGLVNAVVPFDEVVPTARTLAERIAANAPLGVAACRELVRLAAVDDAAYAARRDHWRRVVFSSDDAREGAAAFVEGRDPRWSGR